jgi:hypothetical protein
MCRCRLLPKVLKVGIYVSGIFSVSQDLVAEPEQGFAATLAKLSPHQRSLRR